MGGCRCSYRNCTLRTDGKTHMFHYPVFDKVRCHQWLTNARKLEFLNLKVSQLKNRVICQHHFKDENFMNFKKDKLTFDAVPTEDGPYCDSSQLDGKNNEGDDTKVFSISLDDIEDEYLTIVDKRANFSVKYGDFLTNCDLMDLDTLNQINDNNQINVNNQIHHNNQIPTESVSVFHSHVPKEPIPFSRPLRSNTKINNWNSLDNSSNNILKDKTNRKNEIIQDNILIDYNKTPDISNKNEMQQIMQDQNSINLMLNVSHVPIEFDRTNVNDQQMPVEFVESISNTQRQEMPIEFVPPANSNDQNRQDQSINFKSLEEPKPLNENTNRSQLKGKTKIRIISEKKQILEPVPLIGKLEPVSPNRILTLPSQKKFIYPKPIQPTPEVGNNSIKENSNEVTIMDNVVLEKPKTEPSHMSSNTPASISRKNNILTQKTNKIHSFRKHIPNDISHGTSLLKNKIPPERIAAIAEKRKFNMKLRDIIEDCLDKLDEQDKTDYDKRKPSHKSRKMETKMQQVDSYLAKEPELPEVQDYTIAYLEARLKKMENNLLNKIDENSQKIESLKLRCEPSSEKKTIHTQTLDNEDLHKKQLYQELSKYLSQEANNLIYEELFINKFTQQVPKSPSAKRRKHR